MIRTTMFAAILLTAGLVTINQTNNQAQQQQCCEEVKVFDADTAEMAAHYGAFKTILCQNVDALSQRTTTMAEAVQQVRQAAGRHSPIYLERIARSESGDSVDERIARNLFGHVESFTEVNPDLVPRVAELHTELEAFLRNLETPEID